MSLLRSRKPVAQKNNVKEMIIRDNSRIIQALRYTSIPINLVSSSALMTLIFAQSVKFYPTFILPINFPLARYSTEPLLWLMVVCCSSLKSCCSLTPFSKALWHLSLQHFRVEMFCLKALSIELQGFMNHCEDGNTCCQQPDCNCFT